MWDLVPWPGIKLRSSALGAWQLSHWTTREVPDLGLSLQKSQGSQFPLLLSSSIVSTNFSFFQYSRLCGMLLTWRSSSQIPKGRVCSPCHRFPFYVFRASLEQVKEVTGAQRPEVGLWLYLSSYVTIKWCWSWNLTCNLGKISNSDFFLMQGVVTIKQGKWNVT